MKKVVMKLEIDSDKQKRKAIKAVSSISAKKMTVVGDVDPVELICKLRKSWHADFITVGPAIEEKKDGNKKIEENKEKKIVDKKKTEAEQIAELVKAYKSYNPSLTQPYFISSVEEDPNACVIC